MENELYQYFYNHPAVSMDDFLVIAQGAYTKARKAVIPVYQPKKVKLLESEDDIEDTFDMDKIVKREVFQDESTFDDYE